MYKRLEQSNPFLMHLCYVGSENLVVNIIKSDGFRPTVAIIMDMDDKHEWGVGSVWESVNVIRIGV